MRNHKLSKNVYVEKPRLIFEKIMMLQTNLTTVTDMVMIVLFTCDECIKQHLLNILLNMKFQGCTVVKTYIFVEN